MSDTFSTFSSPIMHPFFEAQPNPAMSLPPQTSPHLPHPQGTSSYLSFPQVTSPYLPHPQVAPRHLPHPEVSSAYFPHYQVTSSHLSDPQVKSPRGAHPQGISLHLFPQAQETLFDSSHLEMTPSQIPPLPQDLLFGTNPCTDLNHPAWDGLGLPCLLTEDGSPFQNQTPVLMDERAQLPSNSHTHFGHALNTWGALEQTQHQPRLSPMDATSEGLPFGGWSSVEALPDVQFYNDAPQPFYSPTTPGPSPHYPSTSALYSDGPHRSDGPDLHSQQSFNSSLKESHQQLLQKMSPFPELNPHQSGLPSSTGLPEDDFSRQGRDVRLNHREERRGGAAPDFSWMKTMKPERGTEVQNSRLPCLVCKRDFRSLPALNGHMRSHRDVLLKKDPKTMNKCEASMVMPVTVPVQSRGTPKAWRDGHKRCRKTRGGLLYCSLMKLDEEEEGRLGSKDSDGGHYVPPLMLSPIRTGSGLFCTVATQRRKRAQTVLLHNGLGDVGVGMATTPRGTLITPILKPRINVGPDFQANIPLLLSKKQACFDSHNALLVWTPWAELERPVTQQRVEALLRMGRSSVVVVGGASPDHTLHVLSESKGDFLLTVEKLLFTDWPTGVCWSAAEKRLLVKTLHLHQKNFRMVQKAVKTKTLAECVEFYYLFKRKMNLSVNPSARLIVTLPEENSQSSSGCQDTELLTEGHTTSREIQKCRTND